MVTTYADRHGNPCAAADAFTANSVTESAWSPEQQELVLALTMLKARKCACGCGLDAIDTQVEPKDANWPAWDIHSMVCTARAALEIAERDAAELARPKADRDPKWREGHPQPGDGMQRWVTKPADLLPKEDQ